MLEDTNSLDGAQIMFSGFDKLRKAQNACALAAPYFQRQNNGVFALDVSVVDQKHIMKSKRLDLFSNFLNIEISKVLTFH